ncbi:MAG: PAS domain S-box protein [Firmicutes bacterium]|nr:PAS domain S-box protein [Bacillota bacterium]
MEAEMVQREHGKGPDSQPTYLFTNPQFWSILSIFILITLHHYDNLTSFRIFAGPDLPLGLTRHTIDRILYLVPVILSSFAFGSRGGKITLVFAAIAMLPRAIFISEYPITSLWETAIIVALGSLAPLGLDHYKQQEKQLEETKERLESTERELHTTVQLTLEQERQLSVINSFSMMLSQSLNIEQVMKAAIHMVREVIDVEVVMIHTIDHGEQFLKLVAYKGISKEASDILGRIRIGEGLCGKVASTGDPIVTDDVVHDPKFNAARVQEESLISKLCVPLAARGETIGTICVASREERVFRDPEIELLSALGNLIGIAINNSVLYRERQIAADQLKVSEKRYRQLFENAHDAIWVQDLSGKITAANQAAADLFGCELKELIGMDSGRFFLPEKPVLSNERREAILRGQEGEEPYRRKIIKKDGTEAFVMLTANLITRDGGPEGIQFIGRDITEEVRMQENQAFYLQQITKGHEDERQRISRDLHDSTAQNLIAMLRQLEKFNEDNTQLPKEKQEFLWKLHGQIKSTLQEIRQLSRDLRPSVLDNLGLLPAVEWLVEMLETEDGVKTTLIVSGKEKRFSQEIEITLFRIVQEALRNIARHAEAKNAKVIMEFKDKETRVEIVDDGKGFELPSTIGDLSRRGKLGIDGMQTRAKLAGGTFEIQSRPGEGTVITVTIPV